MVALNLSANNPLAIAVASSIREGDAETLEKLLDEDSSDCSDRG